jgi:hypothetical protein
VAQRRRIRRDKDEAAEVGRSRADLVGVAPLAQR